MEGECKGAQVICLLIERLLKMLCVTSQDQLNVAKIITILLLIN